MKIESLIVGGLCFGSSLNEIESENFLDKSFDLGIRDLDTGSLYGNGKSEIIIGNYMKKTNKIFNINSKIGLERIKREDGSFGVKVAKLTNDYLIKSTENSLKKIGQKKISRISIHAFCKSISAKEQIKSIKYLLNQQMIDSYGICNFNPEELLYWIQTCLENNLPLPKSLDLHFNLFEQRALFELFPILEKYKIDAIPYRIFCRGLLADRYQSEKNLPFNSRANYSWRVKKYVTEKYISNVNYLKILAKENNYSLLSLILQWTFSFGCIKKVCIGTSSIVQLHEIINSLKTINVNDQSILKKINDDKLPVDCLKMPEVFFET